MSETGIVISSNGSVISIKMKRQEACAKCRACVAGLTEKEMILEAKNECEAQVGDVVEVSLNPKYALNAVFILYGVPLVFLLLGIAAGYCVSLFYKSIDYIEIFSFLGGMSFLALSFFIVKRIDQRINKTLYVPIAIKRIDS